MKKKKNLSNYAVLILAVCLVLIAGEVLIRAYTRIAKPGRSLLVKVQQERNACEHDSLLGWKMRQYATRIFVGSSKRLRSSFNSKGIRGPEYSYTKHSDEYRILVLGDSFALGLEVNFEELFSEVLRRELNGRGEGLYEVINAGVSGYSTDQELLFFQNEGRKYNPDLTMVIFFDNDVWYNNCRVMQSFGKPVFTLMDDATLALTNVPVRRPDRVTPAGIRAGFQGVKQWMSKNLRLYTLARECIKTTYYLHAWSIRLRLVGPYPSSRETSFNNDVPYPAVYNVYRRTPDKELSDAWRITEALLKQLQKECSSIGSDFLVVYLPSRAQIYRGEWNALRAKYGFSEQEWNIDQPGIEVRSLCGRNGIAFLDVTEQFREKTRKLKKPSLYFDKADEHLTARGHLFFGRLLADYIIGGGNSE